MNILEQTFWGNTVQAWLVAAGIALASMVALEILKRIIVLRLSAFAKTTATDIDDLIADLLSRIRFGTLLTVSVYVAALSLRLPAPVLGILRTILFIVLLLQGAVWGNGIISYWVNRTVKSKLSQDAASATTLAALGFLGKMTLWTVVLLLALDNLGVNITALVAGLGVGGIAVALALQNILGDLFASLSIVLDRPFVVGDAIAIEGVEGDVEQIGLKTTRIRSVNGEQIVIANNDLLKSRVRNFKRMSERRILFTVGVTYQTPHAKLAAIPATIRSVIEAQRNTRFDRSHFKEYGDSALIFETVYYATNPDYNMYMDIQQKVNLELYRRFEAEKIEFAYPTRTLFLQNQSPSARPKRKRL